MKDEVYACSVWRKRVDEMLSNDKKAAEITLWSLLETAVQYEADAIELEYAPEGLEAAFMRGNVGIGNVIQDDEAIGRIIGELVAQAKLERKTRGTFKWIHEQKEYEVRAEEYESFGESAFRLVLKKSRRRAR